MNRVEEVGECYYCVTVSLKEVVDPFPTVIE